MANERKLRILIDSSGAKKGGQEVTKEMGRVVASGKQAIKTFKELKKILGEISALQKSATTKTTINKPVIPKPDTESFKPLIKHIQDTNIAVTESSRKFADFVKATKSVGEGLNKNEATLKVLNTELGKSAIAAKVAKTNKEGLLKAVVQSNEANLQEYESLYRLTSQTKAAQKAIRDRINSEGQSFKVIVKANAEQKAYNSVISKATKLQGILNSVKDGSYSKAVKLERAISNEKKAILASLNAKTNDQRQIEANIKAHEKLENTMYAEAGRLKALNSEMGKNSVKVQEQRRLTEELTRSKERLNMVNSKEYTDLVRTRKAIEDRNKQIRMMDADVRRSTISVSGLQSAFSSLGTVMAGLAVYFSVGAIARTADEYTNITNKLKAVSDATVDTTNATRDLLDLSIESRSSLQGTMEIYSKMTRVNEDLGKSQKEVRDLTEAVSKSVAMSGASVQGAQGALMQFGQAMSGDFKAAGQELNSILEQTPMLAVAMAKGLREVTGNATITTGSLKEMAAAGELSTELVFQAMLKVLPEIRKQFESTDQTMSSAMEGLQSSFTVMLGELDKTYGTSESLVDIMKELGEVMVDNGDIILALSASLAGIVGAAALGGLIAALLAIGPLIVGVVGAIGLLVGGITSVYLESSKYTRALDKQIKANKQLVDTTDDFIESLQVMGSLKIVDNIDRIGKEINTLKDDISGLNDELKGMQDPVMAGFKAAGMQQQLDSLRSSQSAIFQAAEAMEKLNTKQALKTNPVYLNLQSQIKEKEDAIRIKETQLDAAQKELAKARIRDFENSYESLGKVIEGLEGNSKSSKSLKIYKKDLEDISKAATKAMKDAKELSKDDALKAQTQQVIVTRDSIDAQRIALDKYIKSVPTLLSYLDEERSKNDDKLASQIKHKNNLIEINSIYKANVELLRVQAEAGLINTDQLKEQLGVLREQRKEAEKISSRESNTGFLGGIKDMFEFGIDWNNISEILGSGMGDYLVQLLVAEGGNSEASGQLGAAGGAIGSLWGPAGAMIGQTAGSIIGSFVDDVTVDFAKIQAEQFTGEILGSTNEQTMSLVNALTKIEDLNSKMLGVNRGMLDALTKTESGIKNVTNSLISLDFDYSKLSKAGVNYSGIVGAQIDVANALSMNGLDWGKIATKVLGGKSSVSDSGVKLLGKSFTSLMEGATVQAYQVVKTRKNWFASTKTKTSISDISSTMADPIEQVMQSIGDNIKASGEALGYTSNEIQNLMSRVNIATLQISTKDMNADQVNKAFSAYFSSVFNTVSENVFSFVKGFQQAGEAFGDTLVRVTTNFQTVNEILTMLGQSTFTKGAVEALSTANDIIEALGGSDKAASTWMNFFKIFASESEQLTYTQDALTEAFQGLGMTLPKTREDLWAYVKTLNLSNASDRERLGLITNLTDSLDSYYGDIGDLTDSIEDATDTAFGGILDWINKIAGTTTNGYQTLQSAQSAFNLQLASARAGNKSALESITDYADAVIEATERSATSSGQVSNVKASLTSQLTGLIPAFANGGYHEGGLRLVGENGPELEYTGSSNIYNNRQMESMFDVSELIAEVKEMRQVMQTGLYSVAKNTGKSTDILRRWEGDGIPAERVV